MAKFCALYEVTTTGLKQALETVRPGPRGRVEEECFDVVRGANHYRNIKDFLFVAGKGDSRIAAFVAEMKEWEAEPQRKPNPVGTREWLSALNIAPPAQGRYRVTYRGAGRVEIDKFPVRD